MRKRISRVLVVVGASGAIAISGIGVAQASNGADDPPGQHQEHKNGKHKHKHHHGQHHQRQAGDRQGGRGGAAEPGDDRGAQGVVEPGDDNGGHGTDDGPSHT